MISEAHDHHQAYLAAEQHFHSAYDADEMLASWAEHLTLCHRVGLALFTRLVDEDRHASGTMAEQLATLHLLQADAAKAGATKL